VAALALAFVKMLLYSAVPPSCPPWLCIQDMPPAQVPMLHIHTLAETFIKRSRNIARRRTWCRTCTCCCRRLWRTASHCNSTPPPAALLTLHQRACARTTACIPGRACMPGRLRLEFADEAGGGKGVLPGINTQVLLMCLRPAHAANVPEAAVAAALLQFPAAPHPRRAAHRVVGTNLPPGGLPCLACLTPMTLTSHDLTAFLPCILDMMCFAHLSLS